MPGADLKIKKVLFISLTNLGDIILSTPVFEVISRAYPGAVIDVIAGPAGREIFCGQKNVGGILSHKPGKKFAERVEQFFSLRKNRYDLVVDLKNSFLPFLLTGDIKSLMPAVSGVSVHKKDEHLLRVSRIGIPSIGAVFPDYSSPADNKKASLILEDARGKRVVILNPGSKSHLKKWDTRNFARLADRLTALGGVAVLIVGGPEDRITADELKKGLARPVVDLVGGTTIGVLRALMKNASLVITNDSGPLHIASSVDAPVIAIFGPSDERKYGPLSSKRFVFTTDKKCRPCGRALCAAGPDEGCINTITVDDVYSKAVEFLS
jgi:ADP-heptose:LPS heptosyltransferase